MTIASATNKSGPYNGNGVTVAFAGTFKISDQDHVQVILADADGVETVQTITTEYTVSGVGGSGFTVTMLVAPPSGSTVTLIRDVPFTQELDLQNQGAYYAESVEEAFDLAAARDQQLQEQVSRSVKIPASADVDALDTLIANIVLLGDSADDLAALAAISADVETLAAINAAISTVAGISTAVTTVAGISTQVQSVAAVEAELLDIHSDLAALLAVPAAAAASASAAQTARTGSEVARDEAVTAKNAAEAAAGSMTPVADQINAATDTDFLDADMLTARKASDGSLIKRSWANVKALLAAVFPSLALLTTRGDIIYRDAAGWQRLPKGASGDVLTQGANDPSWAAPDAGGQPIPKSGAYPVGFVVDAYKGSAGSVADGGTTSGANLTHSFVSGNGAITAATGATLSGTWRNVSGSSRGASAVWGLWVRTV